jgi:hypothetical protein
MGKMKEKYMEEQERLIREAVEAFVDDDWQYQEYLKSLNERMGYGTVTQEEVQSNHDDWWNSLTNEQKQQLYLDQEEATKESNDEYLNHWLKNDNNASK